jgi:hypothetical protein
MRTTTDRLIGRVERERQDPVGAGRQLRADRIELRAHVEGRGVDVAAPVELDLERRLLGFGARAQLLDARERRERFLDGPRDQLLDSSGVEPG